MSWSGTSLDKAEAIQAKVSQPALRQSHARPSLCCGEKDNVPAASMQRSSTRHRTRWEPSITLPSLRIGQDLLWTTQPGLPFCCSWDRAPAIVCCSPFQWQWAPLGHRVKENLARSSLSLVSVPCPGTAALRCCGTALALPTHLRQELRATAPSPGPAAAQGGSFQTFLQHSDPQQSCRSVECLEQANKKK